MPRIERKNIKNKPFCYLTRRIRVGNRYKKIQVYVGKNVPNDLKKYLKKLKAKELEIVNELVNLNTSLDERIAPQEYKKLEHARVSLAYYLYGLTKAQVRKLWHTFAINFIFESNAIEGSRLSHEEVESIVRSRYVKKNLNREEVREVENAIEALDLVRGKEFKLNQRSIIALHSLITRDLGIVSGFKRKNIIVNNKATTAPGEVRAELASLLSWWKEEKKNRDNRFFTALSFHQRFERIHPFEDGNGRTGRMILIWMLAQGGYEGILFMNKNRRAYFSALDKADEGMPRPWFRFAMRVYKKTVHTFLSTYDKI